MAPLAAHTVVALADLEDGNGVFLSQLSVSSFLERGLEMFSQHTGHMFRIFPRPNSHVVFTLKLAQPGGELHIFHTVPPCDVGGNEPPFSTTGMQYDARLVVVDGCAQCLQAEFKNAAMLYEKTSYKVLCGGGGKGCSKCRRAGCIECYIAKCYATGRQAFLHYLAAYGYLPRQIGQRWPGYEASDTPAAIAAAARFRARYPLLHARVVAFHAHAPQAPIVLEDKGWPEFSPVWALPFSK